MPTSFIFVFHLHRLTRLSGIGSVPPSPSLNTGLLIGTEHKLIVFEWCAVPNPVIEIENSSGFGGKSRVPGENPAAMLPWFGGILIEPALHGAPADGSCQTRLSGVLGNIFSAPATKGNVISSRQLTGDCFNLNNDLWGEKTGGGGPVENVLLGHRGAAQRSIFATCRQLPVSNPIWLQFDHYLDPGLQGESSWPVEPSKAF